FRRIQARLGKTVIIVTHDMGEAFALANRIGVLDEGVLVACDRPEAMAASRDPRVRRLLDAVPTVPATRTAEAESLRSRPREGEAAARRGGGAPRE
ncbi:MAG: hypothetical protein ACHQO8_13605, partial [Vicinamibacterales bacterium]